MISKKPLFCKTKEGHYYLTGAGYGVCDKDQDGWINIEAYRAVTSTDKQIQNNARCALKKFQHVVYHAEGQQPQIQKLDLEAAMVETFRNDGGGKLIDLPVYSKDQAALPIATSSACAADTDCPNTICYRGNCVEGRRFEPAEINTLTKGCIAGLDLNDNQLDDATESPNDTPYPTTEFKPLLPLGYFVALHYGGFQQDYDNNGTKIPVFHIYERTRSKTADQQGLALQCQQQADAFLPDYWKRCALKDSQQCPDPNDPTKTKSGLQACWLKDVQRLIPSLFQCVVFDNAYDKTTVQGYFHPENYGFSKHYNRTRCNFAAKLNENDPTKRDIELECTPDDGQRSPDITKKEVGWACVSFQPYAAPANYLGGCVDQKTEKACGDTKDGETVHYITHEKDSYGFARANAPCGNSNGKGECDKALRVCSGGTWLDCNKCDHCPQTTAGQQATCPNGTWPTDSCKLLKNPSIEVCDGLDNDCDGQIDNGLAKTTYYNDADGDGYGNPNDTIARCPAQKPAKYITQAGDCDDTNDKIKPNAVDVCDGIDNNCNGQIDEDATFQNYYRDDDGDGHGRESATPDLRGCVMQGDASKICIGKGNCISLTYTHNGQSRDYKTSHDDCCDLDANAKPGQTKYFTAQNACNNWNYDCNNRVDYGYGNTTNSINLCSCSRSVVYTETGDADCHYNGETRNWYDANCNNCTYTNTTECKLQKTHTFQPSSDMVWNWECAGNKQFNCAASNVNVSWTPKAADGTDLITINRSTFLNSIGGYGNLGSIGCAFLMDGSPPTCGSSQAYLAKVPEATPSSKNASTVCVGSRGCFTATWNHDCTYTWDVTYSSDYLFFKQSGLVQVTPAIGCR
ncbi:MAG: putative metal-binding motif-containing protein [Myxococcales bacterium]|nr:putative metal-binding motif-containing protein [Myxococcales bacterium]